MQTDLFRVGLESIKLPVAAVQDKEEVGLNVINLHSYDHYIVAFSGGKDSTAAFLNLLRQGVDKSKIELWHHEIDGREGSTLMDWTCTPSYCSAFAKAFDVPIYFSWREGGFEREMLRDKSLTGGTFFETPTGLQYRASKDRPEFYNTRRKFPQVSADLSVRWCSSYQKIMVCATSLRNQPRFENRRTLLITGERGEESSARAKYKVFEPDSSDLRASKKKARHIDHYRPILNWLEAEVWSIIEEYKVQVHPAYYLGFGRCSCLFCVFGSGRQMATARHIEPNRFDKIVGYEKEFGLTIKRKVGIKEVADGGEVYAAATPELIDVARSNNYFLPIFIDNWMKPAGAFGESCGPL